MKFIYTVALAMVMMLFAGIAFAASLTIEGTGIGSQALGQQEPWYNSYSFVWLDGANHAPRVSSQYLVPNPWPAQHAGVGTAANGWTSLANTNPGRYALDFEGYHLQNETIFTNETDPNYGHEFRWYSGSPTWKLIDTTSGSQLASGTSEVMFLDVNYAPPAGSGYWVHGNAVLTVTNDGGAFYNDIVSQTGYPNLILNYASSQFPVVYLADRPLADGWATYASTWIMTTTVPVDGICGSSNGSTLASAPTSNLCSQGTPSPVTGTWNWTCNGLYGGTDASCSANIQTYLLTLSFAGTGGGSVSGDMACTFGAACSHVLFDVNTQINLIPLADSQSIFGGWSGACTNTSGNCQFTMNSAKSVTVNFTAASVVKVGTAGFSTLQEAYNDAATQDNDLIKLLEGTLAGDFIGDRDIAINLQGGYNTLFDAVSTETAIDGKIQLRNGTVRVKSINVK